MTAISSRPGRLLSVLLVAAGLTSGAAVAAGKTTVVELFTSQGCSSCPPANANLSVLSRRPGLIALSFGVTYWDRLGWKDTFGRKDYTARQAVYEGPLGEGGPFTPQIVVGGRASLVGDDLSAIERSISADAAIADAASVSVAPSSVTVGPGRPKGDADIWLVRYDPRLVQVPVRAGENGGRTLPHTNVVHDLSRIGVWSGAAIVIPVKPAPDGLRTAVLVQAGRGGPILAAASD